MKSNRIYMHKQTGELSLVYMSGILLIMQISNYTFIIEWDEDNYIEIGKY